MISMKLLFTIGWVYLICLASAGETDMRLWRDVHGRKFEARLVKVSSRTVRLENEEGKQINFPISDLTESSKEYVKANNPEGVIIEDRPASTASSESSAPSLPASKIEKAMKGKTVLLQKGNLKEAKGGINPNAKYYAIYYSAHWCPPCRKFTPELVSFYKRYKKKYNNFEVIFVSSDKSESKMEEYMEWGDMSFPALAHDERPRAITKYSGKGIPCLVVVDRNGEVLSDSYDGGNYVGPGKVLKDLERLIKK